MTRRVTMMSDEEKVPEGVELPGDGNGPDDVADVIDVDYGD